MALGKEIGGNRVVWALSLARMGDAIGNSILFVVIPLYVSVLPHPLLSLHEPLMVAVLISTYGLLTTVMQPVAGALGDWLRRRKLLIEVGLGVVAAATLGFIWAGRYADLLWLRVGQGIGFSLTVPASLALLAMGTRRETRGGSMGIYTALRMVGFSIGPLLGGYLLDHFGFSLTFFTGAGFVIVGMAAVGIWVPEEPPSHEPREFKLFGTGLINRGLIAVATSTMVMAIAFSELVPLEKTVNARTHETAFGFGLSFTALMVARLLLQIPLGRYSDHIGRKPVIISGLAVLTPATVLLATSRSMYALAGWRLLQGVGAAAIAGPAFAVAADLSARGGEGRQMSIATMGFTLGIAIGPLIGGWLVSYFFALPFIVSAALCPASALLIYVYTPETVKRKA